MPTLDKLLRATIRSRSADHAVRLTATASARRLIASHQKVVPLPCCANRHHWYARSCLSHQSGNRSWMAQIVRLDTACGLVQCLVSLLNARSNCCEDANPAFSTTAAPVRWCTSRNAARSPRQLTHGIFARQAQVSAAGLRRLQHNHLDNTRRSRRVSMYGAAGRSRDTRGGKTVQTARKRTYLCCGYESLSPPLNLPRNTRGKQAADWRWSICTRRRSSIKLLPRPPCTLTAVHRIHQTRWAGLRFSVPAHWSNQQATTPNNHHTPAACREKITKWNTLFLPIHLHRQQR